MRAWDEAESSPMLQRSVVPLSVPYDKGVLQNRGQGSRRRRAARLSGLLTAFSCLQMRRQALGAPAVSGPVQLVS